MSVEFTHKRFSNLIEQPFFVVCFGPSMLIRILSTPEAADQGELRSRAYPSSFLHPATLRQTALEQLINLLTVECPNVTLCYKVKMTFLNPNFNQIRMEIANFWLLFGL